MRHNIENYDSELEMQGALGSTYLENGKKRGEKMMHKNLPESYEKFLTIDFENDKKVATQLSIATVAVAVLLFVLPLIFRKVCAGGVNIWLGGAIVLGGALIYSVLHELVHALYIILFLRQKPQFKFSFPYVYVGCDCAYFKLMSYAAYALAPIAILGAAIAWVGSMLPINYFWCIYVIQIFNISGATSDFYAIYKIAKAPRNSIAQDAGHEIFIFTHKGGI